MKRPEAPEIYEMPDGSRVWLNALPVSFVDPSTGKRYYAYRDDAGDRLIRKTGKRLVVPVATP